MFMEKMKARFISVSYTHLFVDGNVITDVCVDGKTYDVQPVTEELIEMRDY